MYLIYLRAFRKERKLLIGIFGETFSTCGMSSQEFLYYSSWCIDSENLPDSPIQAIFM